MGAATVTSDPEPTVPITCAHCSLGTGVSLAALRAGPDSVTCDWCKRTFAPDRDEVLDGLDQTEREIKLFSALLEPGL